MIVCNAVLKLYNPNKTKMEIILTYSNKNIGSSLTRIAQNTDEKENIDGDFRNLLISFFINTHVLSI